VSDATQTQRVAVKEDQIFVQSPSQLLITKVEPSQGEITAGQTNPWTVKAVVHNTGASNINILVGSDSTYLKFNIGNDFRVTNPTKLEGGGSATLASDEIDSLYFTVDTTGMTVGSSKMNLQLAYVDVNALSDTLYITNSVQKVKVETKPDLRVVELIGVDAPNFPSVNTSQNYKIRVKVENAGDDGVHDLLLNLVSDGNSTIGNISTFSVAGHAIDSLDIDITADANPAVDEVFTATIDTAVGDNTAEFDSLIITQPFATAQVAIHQPAAISIESIILPGGTINASQENWEVLVVVRRDGQEAVQFDPFLEDSIKFIINNNVQTDYIINDYIRFKNTNGLVFQSGGVFRDTLVYKIEKGGVVGGNGVIQVTLTGTNLNNTNKFLVRDTKNVYISSTAELNIVNTDVICPRKNDNVGIVSSEQAFKIRVKLKNDGEEPINNIEVRLTSDDETNYPIPPVKTINALASGFEDSL
jgi:hypothetical protein